MIRVRIRAGQADARNILLKALSRRAMAAPAARAVRAGLEVLADEVRDHIWVDTGKAKRSVRVVVDEAEGGSASGAVEVGEHYAAFKEFGTKDMPADPVLRPALAAKEAAATRAVADSLRNDLT